MLLRAPLTGPLTVYIGIVKALKSPAKEKEGQSSGWIRRWATNITDVATMISKP